MSSRPGLAPSLRSDDDNFGYRGAPRLPDPEFWRGWHAGAIVAAIGIVAGACLLWLAG